MTPTERKEAEEVWRAVRTINEALRMLGDDPAFNHLRVQALSYVRVCLRCGDIDHGNEGPPCCEMKLVKRGEAP